MLIFGVEYVDAGAATFKNIGRDQIIITNSNFNPLGAIHDHPCTVTCSFSII